MPKNMKKIVFLSLFAMCLPWTLWAQSIDDDLYYVPSKKAEKKETKQDRTTPAAPVDEVVVKSNAPTTVYTSPTQTTVVVRDTKGRTRDVDEYNRRYDSSDYDFSMEDDTLYVDEKPYDGLDGEWVSGFDGSADDYEYATRIIRFRNPRYAISISSPLYWDVVYGLDSWNWNVYTDGLYAYAFPTFTNPVWLDWRYNSYGWWGYPYYGWGWSGWYGPGWGLSWGGWWSPYYYHHYYPGWYPGHSHWGGRHWGNAYTTRRSYGGVSRSYATRNSSTMRRSSAVNGAQDVRRSRTSSTGSQIRRTSSTSGTRRVVGTRQSSATNRSSVSRSRTSTTRSAGTYTRPSSTRSSSYGNGSVGVRSSRSAVSGLRSSNGSATRTRSTYSRGSSTAPSRSYYNNNSERSSRSYSAPVRSSGSSRSSFSTGGGSMRSSSGMGGGGGRSSVSSRRR